MNFEELRGMSDQDVLDLFNSIPSPFGSESNNIDHQILETILNDFNKREINKNVFYHEPHEPTQTVVNYND